MSKDMEALTAALEQDRRSGDLRAWLVALAELRKLEESGQTKYPTVEGGE